MNKNLDNNQIKLVLLTMKLDIQVQQFNLLCNKLEELKKDNISSNSTEYENILKEFKKRYNEIVKIRKELKKVS